MNPRRLVALVALGATANACERRERLSAPDTIPTAPVTQVSQGTAYLRVSDLAPATGDTIIVGVNVQVGDSVNFSSFRARLSYDAASLIYLEEVVVPGMMRVVNPTPGEVIVAGASSTPSVDGVLFAARFRVVSPAGVRSLATTVDELNDPNYGSHAGSLGRTTRLQLDGALAPRR